MASPYSVCSEMPPQARQRSLADVQKRIAETEASRTQWLSMVKPTKNQGGRPRGARG